MLGHWLSGQKASEDTHSGPEAAVIGQGAEDTAPSLPSMDRPTRLVFGSLCTPCRAATSPQHTRRAHRGLSRRAGESSHCSLWKCEGIPWASPRAHTNARLLRPTARSRCTCRSASAAWPPSRWDVRIVRSCERSEHLLVASGAARARNTRLCPHGPEHSDVLGGAGTGTGS